MNLNFESAEEFDSSATEVRNNETVFKKEPCMQCLRLPKAVYFIIITELCERFTFYGMRSILILYLTQHLLLQEGNAVSVYHFFIGLCYFTTIFGSFIADNYLGKFRTLVIIGTVYTIGSTLMSLTAISTINLVGPLISLTLIGFGTGGVKACVGPFGGDQIPLNKASILTSYFSMFYFAINCGALLSTITTPILRANVACNGSDDCYPLAFGVPAILMGIALVIFLASQRYYVDIPIKGSIYLKAARCIAVSIKTWYRERHTNPKKHLLDYASIEYDEQFIRDLRTLSHIAVLYLPLPVYWALYEQMGSRWTLQAAQMDGELTENLYILPDQMFIFNVLLVVIFIVLFDSCIFPLLNKVIPSLRPLRKMTVGITFTFLAFLAAFILQKYMEGIQPPKIDPLYSRVLFVNDQPCPASLSINDGRILQSGVYASSQVYLDVPAGFQQIQLNTIKCNGAIKQSSLNQSVLLSPGQKNFLISSLDSWNNVSIRVVNDSRAPNIKGYPVIKVMTSSDIFQGYSFNLIRSSTRTLEKSYVIGMNQSLLSSEWQTLSRPGRYTWTVIGTKMPSSNGTLIPMNLVSQGRTRKIVSSEVTIFYMTYSRMNGSLVVIPLSIHTGARVSILWQLPQYLLISVGEVLVNIPGLAFSYDQAPVGMKSLVTALWYMCDAFGNTIVMVVAKIQLFENQSWEYLTFAVICVMFNVIFAVLAHNYPMAQKEEYVRMT